ncbi:MAG: hypothetical protein IIA72_16995 [Proteobacteria bacterium]|nr:hypothetical protein [Pseudomonadota bacterium]
MDINEKNKELYSRLFVSCSDIHFARQCARHILKKGWHCDPWERRGTIYFQQSVYTTALIVSYARPFTKSAGWPSFPTRLLQYTEAERGLHKKLLKLRNKIYAHSDSESYSIRPYRSGSYSVDIVGEPFLKISEDEAVQFLEMTAKGLASIEDRMQQLRPSVEKIY